MTAAIALAASAAVLPAPALAGPAAPTAPYTAITLTGPASGNHMFNGSKVLDATTATVTATPWGAEGLVLGATPTAGDPVSVEMVAPPSTPWQTGTTYQVQRSANGAYAGMDVSVSSRGCNQTSGSLTVLQVTRNAGALTAFAASYSYQCDNDQPVTGQVRWNSTVGYNAVALNTSGIDFGSQEVNVPGTPQQVVLTSLGSEATTLGSAGIVGPHSSAFSVTADTCSGATLAYGATCAVTIKPLTALKGQQTAQLSIPNSTTGGSLVVSLALYGTDAWAGNKGTYTTLNPNRILDTRSGLGAAGKVGPGGILHLQVGGRGGVPATGVSAVTLNVTVTEPTSSGFLTLFPTGVARPTASSLNFLPGWTGANSVTVKVSADGGVDIYNHAGLTHIIADVQGYYTDSDQTYSMGGFFHPIAPRRLIDTREGAGGKLPSNYYLRTGLNFNAANPHIRAYVVNVTATQPEGPGFLTAWNGHESDLQPTSTLNYQRAETVPNLAVVPVAPCWGCGSAENWPVIGVYTMATTHVIVDIVGFFDDGTYSGDGLRFDPVTPTRIVDSREGQGVPGALNAQTTTKVTAPAGVLDTKGGQTYSLALNVTAVDPTADTFLTVWPSEIPGLEKPWVSNLNPHPGKVTPNAVVTGIGPSNGFNVFNHAGRLHLVVDVVGRYYFHAPSGSALRSPGASVPAPDAGPVAIGYKAAA
ncbi:hypothetical protein [Longispora fulva]|uniref:IgGFc-binding protein N-terminal domain-containing protein n=1 Tax=Longispora fulva TaxID=619741 RepID=A0A8J7GHJ6_9ACTN|nr:hypothetical protein [Longispora fulva]MBG6139269.1 hypothetical protein [Longispora fulva]